jgi:hypothetical protein
MCLDLLAKGGWRRLEVRGWFDIIFQIESEVPGAYDTVAATGIPRLLSMYCVWMVLECILACAERLTVRRCWYRRPDR